MAVIPAGSSDGFPVLIEVDTVFLWNILACTPGGRGTDWYPKLDYGRMRGPPAKPDRRRADRGARARWMRRAVQSRGRSARR